MFYWLLFNFYKNKNIFFLIVFNFLWVKPISIRCLANHYGLTFFVYLSLLLFNLFIFLFIFNPGSKGARIYFFRSAPKPLQKL